MDIFDPKLRWEVWSTDNDNTETLIKTGLTKEAAMQFRSLYEGQDVNKWYWIQPQKSKS